MSSTRRPDDNEEGGVLESLIVGIVRGFTALVFDANQFHHVSYVRRKAQPGDILEFRRSFYSHYALYLGNGKVMNIDAEDKNNTEALIRERTLEDVCGSSTVRVRNHEDIARKHFQALSKSVYETIRAAKSFENRVVPYQFDFRNCEYYSTLWRYGAGFSTQAAKPTTTPIGSFVGGAANASQVTRAVFNGTDALVETEGYANYKRLAKK